MRVNPNTKAQAVVDTAKQVERAKNAARCTLMPTANAALVAQSFSNNGPLDLVELVTELRQQCSAVNKGDLGRMEAMLAAQAHSLDTLFANLARRAAENMGEYLGATEMYMRLALKAQAQCRATVETLATIKNPPVVFAKQANIAHGHQQVNNGLTLPVARAETENKQTELLEHEHGEQRLDTGTTRTAIRIDQAMGTVEALPGSANQRRQSQGKP